MKHLLPILTVLLFSCSQEIKNSITEKSDEAKKINKEISKNIYQAISRPFEKLDIDYSLFIYNPKKINRFELSSGTKITIPKDAFIDQNGETINKKVSIKYREFHNPASIIVSGINMDYKNGKFESAGMFEIRAFDQETELSIAKDKQIEVDLASYKKGKDFENFYLNENTGWSPTNDANIVPNQSKLDELEELDDKIKELDATCVYKPRKFDVSNDEILDLALSSHLYKELGMFSDAMWKVVIKPKNYHVASQNIKWTHVELQPLDCEKFNLVVNNWKAGVKDKTTLIVEVIPVWSGKAFEKKRRNYAKERKKFFNDYDEKMRRRKQKSREADMLRKFYVDNMGIWNSDRVIKENGYLAIKPTFNFGNVYKEEIAVFLISNNSTVIKYYFPQDLFKINPKHSNKLLVILPGDIISIVKPEEIDAVFSKKNYDIENNDFEFIFKPEDTPCTKVKELENVLAVK